MADASLPLLDDLDKDAIVFGGVATENGVIVCKNKVQGLDAVIEQLCANVDMLVDNRYALAPHTKTFGVMMNVSDELCFVCAAKPSIQQRICFAMLANLEDEWNAAMRGKKPDYKAFRDLILQRMEYFSADPDADRLRSLMLKVQDTTTIMVDNVDKLLKRGEKLDDIIERSEGIHVHARKFKKQSVAVKYHACKENMKMTVCLIITIFVAVIALVLLGIGLWFFFTKVYPIG